MTETDIQRRLAVLETQHAALVDDLDEIKSDVRTIRDVIVSGRGSMRVVALLFGGAIAVSGVVATWLGWFVTKPG